MREETKRREQILNLLRETGSVQVAPLALRFAVSPHTIRQDLNFLVQLGIAGRADGGAVLREATAGDAAVALEQKRIRRAAEKAAIGRVAAQMIRDGESIMLDSGTTTLEVASHIPRDVTVMVATNDLAIANELAHHDNVELLVLGGSLRRKSMSLFGTQAETAVRSLSFDKVFLGVDGFDLERGITTTFESEAILDRLVCSAASDVIVVADSSKFGVVCMHRIIELQRVRHLVTDPSATPQMLEQLRAVGIETHVAEP